ncbi:MAG: hypothetical protein RLZZ215_2926 [Pseudomonadota bacterium]|jgi:ankyrin repeat protein
MLKLYICSFFLLVINSLSPSWAISTHESTNQSLQEKLLKAIEHKDLNQVKHLVEQGVSLAIATQAEVTNQAHADSYNHFLRRAVFVGSLPILQYLLDHGAELETQLPYSSFSGMSLPNILTSAINSKSSDSQEMVRTLLNAGANPNLIGNGDYAEDDIPLLNALSLEKYEIAQLLLSYGADPNVYTPNHDRPLWDAVETKDVQAVTLLINAGTDVNLPPKDSLTLTKAICHDDSSRLALDAARAQPGEASAQIEKLLLSAGARSIKDLCHQAGL